MKKHDFTEFDIELMEQAKQMLIQVYTHYCDDPKMQNRTIRLEGIVQALDELQAMVNNGDME